ncbi:MAG: hypothetical protein KC983_12470, partial [Phycisphaerales bacterium]|nr:hypothetical protein [Phycisphaerales bacterium]
VRSERALREFLIRSDLEQFGPVDRWLARCAVMFRAPVDPKAVHLTTQSFVRSRIVQFSLLDHMDTASLNRMPPRPLDCVLRGRTIWPVNTPWAVQLEDRPRDTSNSYTITGQYGFMLRLASSGESTLFTSIPAQSRLQINMPDVPGFATNDDVVHTSIQRPTPETLHIGYSLEHAYLSNLGFYRPFGKTEQNVFIVRFVNDILEAIPPVQMPVTFKDAMQDTLSINYDHDAGAWSIQTTMGIFVPLIKASEETGFFGDFVISQRGRLLATLIVRDDLRWCIGLGYRYSQRRRMSVGNGDPPDPRGGPITVRFTPDLEAALYDFDVESFWDGTFEFEVDVESIQIAPAEQSP